MTSPSTPVLSVVTESTDLDRGRRRSIQHNSEGNDSSEGGLTRSVSRRKRWSNILLRRDSGEFQRSDDVSTSDSVETSFPKSPLSQGFPAYADNADRKQTQDHPTQDGKTATRDTVDADGFSSVALTPNEGQGLSLKTEENVPQSQKENTPPNGGVVDTQPKDLATALPTKEETHPSQSKDSSGTN
jgi:hypothetical protein